MPPENPTTQPAGIEQIGSQLSRLVSSLSETTFTGWLVLLAGLFAGVAAGKIAQLTAKTISKRLHDKDSRVRALLVHAAARPISLALITAGLSIGLTSVVLTPEVKVFAARVIVLLFTIAIGWFIYNLIDLLDLAMMRMAQQTESKLDDQLVPLISRTVRLFTIVVFALFTAQNVFGADITAWLAGLGIAGLAVSLAAQDSIKNMFGSVTIFMDRAFAVGDLVIFSGHEGTVEEIGFRSTKLRTPDGHLVTIPNSKVVDNTVVNIARRKNIRRIANLRIAFDTPAEKMEQAVRIVKEILADPDMTSAFDLRTTPPKVAFNDLNADSLNINVIYWFYTAPGRDPAEHAEKFNLKVLRAFKEAGISLAIPSQRVYLASESNRDVGA